MDLLEWNPRVCRSNNGTEVHYIDFIEIEERVENLKTFTMFAEKF